MERWKFGINNKKLIELVLSNRKTATCWIYDGNNSMPGEESILLNDNDVEVCKLRTLDVKILKFKDVTWDLAKLEGEYNSLSEWKNSHFEFFKGINEKFNEDSLIEFEVFEIIEKYKK